MINDVLVLKVMRSAHIIYICNGTLFLHHSVLPCNFFPFFPLFFESAYMKVWVTAGVEPIQTASGEPLAAAVVGPPPAVVAVGKLPS